MPRFRDEFEFAGSIAMLPLHQVTLPTVRLDWSLFILMCWSWQRFWSFLCIFAAKHWCLLVMRFGWRFWIIFTSNFFKLAVFFATLCNSRFQIEGDFCKCSYSLHLDNVSLHFNHQALNLDTCCLVVVWARRHCYSCSRTTFTGMLLALLLGGQWKRGFSYSIECTFPSPHYKWNGQEWYKEIDSFPCWRGELLPSRCWALVYSYHLFDAAYEPPC